MRRLSHARALMTLGVAFLAAAFVACEDEVEPGNVAGEAPWSDGERAIYRLFDEDGDVLGEATLSVEERDGEWALIQQFSTDTGEDSVTVLVDQETLKPILSERVVDGDDGRFEYEASYVEEPGRVIQHVFDGEERRSSSNDVPEFAYDARQGLFLWRTLPLADGYQAAYRSLVTTETLDEPKSFLLELTERGRETIETPAGRFETWRLDAVVNNARQTVWVGLDAPHPIVRFDNGVTTFELESFEP